MARVNRPARGGAWAAALLALGVALVPSVAHGFREDEFECEETMAYLEKCCKGFDAHAVSCSYDDGCGSVLYPTLSAGESRCIRALSCERIRTEQLCERVLERSPKVCDQEGGSCSGGGQELCR